MRIDFCARQSTRYKSFKRTMLTPYRREKKKSKDWPGGSVIRPKAILASGSYFGETNAAIPARSEKFSIDCFTAHKRKWKRRAVRRRDRCGMISTGAKTSRQNWPKSDSKNPPVHMTFW